MSIRYYNVEQADTSVVQTAEVTSLTDKNKCVKPTGNNWFLQVLCEFADEGILTDEELISCYADCM